MPKIDAAHRILDQLRVFAATHGASYGNASRALT